jgi:hypothetical protein
VREKGSEGNKGKEGEDIQIKKRDGGTGKAPVVIKHGETSKFHYKHFCCHDRPAPTILAGLYI